MAGGAIPGLDPGVDLGLTGKRALVTGAGAGIGIAVAQWLARAGCRVAVNDIDGERAAATAQHCGAGSLAVAADVRRADAVEAMVQAVIDGFGGLDIAVNNVGMLGGHGPAPFVDTETEDFAAIVEQNLGATACCCRAEAATMVAQGTGGVILNVSSGESTRPALGLAPYGAAKAAINHLTKTMAVELGPHGIRVNAVAPGTTLTETVRGAFSDEFVAGLTASLPLRRMCEPDDLARLVVLLASDLAAMVTGQLILADGGAHLKPYWRE